MTNMTTYNTYFQQFVQQRIQMPHHTSVRYGRVMSSATLQPQKLFNNRWRFLRAFQTPPPTANYSLKEKNNT